ncbi:Tetratricopeptide repeat protein [Gemmata obscuriglobus]|uniref:Tetratricopeptide repeat protein n=1 Tax=Gemmata obscuriglobus TaxID=114 RepID=A0A2Z3H9A2_9BACT|nr:tetratricopeptide repeat protein [Gemmata obscuriglobus]AWM41471.1 tetratricopeptide repeat protein [Gemmata obscuriglobus]QEG32623.1 Tetratricopeptide repeat protein [Gemmata obscuriglobus]VTS11979.1 hypothetical protein : : TPR_16: TPR_2 [Gemmata obscuriglobus UQM 2246]
MSNRATAAIVFGVFFVCVLALTGLVVTVKVVVERRGAAARLRAEQAQASEREAGRAEAAAAFADPKSPTPEEAAEFAALFANLTKILEKEDGPALFQQFDPERLFEELVRTGRFDRFGLKPGRADRERFIRGMQNAGARAVFNPLFRWQSTNVRRVRWSADRNEAVVIASHVNDSTALGRVKLKVRWWLVRRPGGWRVFDFEDLDQGLRATHLMGALLTPDMLARLPALQKALLAIRATQAAIARQDYASAEAALAGCRPADLPDPIAAVVYLLRAGIHLARGEPNEALAFLDQVERVEPDAPLTHLMRANCYLQSGEHAKALAAADAYIAQLGPDDEAELTRGSALEELNRLDEARAAYRRANDLDPDAPDPLVALGRVLEPKNRSELGDRLGRAADPGRLYDAVRPEIADDDNGLAADALLDGLRKARPDEPRGLSADVRRQVIAGRFDAARALLERGLKIEAARPQVLEAYLHAMCRAKKGREAYAVVPAEYAAQAFRILANDLDDTVSDAEEPEDELPELRELIAAHRRRVPADPWLLYFEGAVFQHEEEYDRAAAAFAAGAAKLPPVNADPERDEFDERAGFRWRQVECLFRAKRGLEAHEKVEPIAPVFQQLAGLYDRCDDLDGLKKLLVAHRKREPNDIQCVYWQAHLKFRAREYAAAAVLFKKFLRESDDKAANRWTARDEYLRGVLRSEPEAAGAVLAEFGEQPVSNPLRAAVAATAGNRTELERLIAEAIRGGASLWFYSDEDFRTAIGQEQWADLRAKYPAPKLPKEAHERP